MRITLQRLQLKFTTADGPGSIATELPGELQFDIDLPMVPEPPPDHDLSAGLVSYWKLDETSGARADSVAASANNLIDPHSITSVAGKVGNAAHYVGAQNLYIPNNASLATGDIDFGGALWVRMANKTASMDCLSKTGGHLSPDEYVVGYDQTADRFRFTIFNGTSYHTVLANTLGSPAVSTWYQILSWHDSTANTLNIRVNNGVVDTVADGGGPVASTSNLIVGSYAGLVNFWVGDIDEVAFYKRVLDDADATAFWNGGAGVTYPFP